MRYTPFAVGALAIAYALWFRSANPSDRARAKRYVRRMGFDQPFEVRAAAARARRDAFGTAQAAREAEFVEVENA